MTVVGEAFVLVSPEGAGFARKLQTQLAGAGLGNVGLVAGVAVTAGIVAGLSSIGAEFGKARRIITQETGAAAADVEKIFGSVRRVVEEVPVSLEKAAKAADLLFKRGVPLGPMLEKLAKQELFLAKITGAELGTTVEKTTAIFAKFAVPIREQSKELDVLFKASQRSGKSLDELLDPLVAGGAALGQFGFSLDKSIALITQLQIAGVNVQPALAGLRKAFVQIAKEGGDPQQALAGLIAEFKDGTDPARAMADAVKLFGSRSGVELATAIQKGKFEVGDLLKIITNGKDGIVATGEATLTLADRFTLLRNQASEQFADIGLAVRKGLVSVVVEASGPLGNLAAGLGHVVAAAAPLGVVFAPVVFALKGVLPSITAFGEGLDVIANGLGVLQNPLGLAAAGIVAIGLASTVYATEVGLAAIATAEFTTTLLTNPYFLAAAAIVALGEAVILFRKSADPAIKLSKDFGRALFDENSATQIFRTGIDNATQGVKDFIAAEVKANSVKGLGGAIKLAGTTVDGLAKAVTGSASAWDQFAKSTAAALKAQGIGGLDFAAITLSLEDQRQAFVLSARAQLDMAIATGVLTKRQAEFVIGQHENADGSRNFAAELDDVNRRLSVQAEKQNSVVLASKGTTDALADLAHQLAEGTLAEKDAETALGALGLTGEEVTIQLDKLKLKAQDLNATTDATALHAASVTSAYGDLATSLATGRTSVAGATLALEDMGLSAAGAATAASDLDSAVRSFVDGAVSQLPDVAKAIGDFASVIKEDQDQLRSDREKNAQLHEKVNEALAKSSADTRQKLASIDLAIQQDQSKIASGQAGTTDKLQRDLLKRSQIIAGSGQASADLAKQVAESNASIIADNKKLADDQNPNRFTANLLAQVAQIASFTTNLRRLIKLGLAPLAGELASQGPEAAAGLAKGFASDPSKAAIANAVLALRQNAQDAFQTLLEENAGPLTGTGAKQGLAIGKAIADGITRELLNNFPLLRQLGITTGDELLGGAKEGAGKSSVTDPIAAQIRLHIPEFRGLGVPVGTAVGQGVGDGIGTVNLTPGLARTLNQHREEFKAAGAGLGSEAGLGISEGILSQRIRVGDAILSVTRYGVSVAKGAWKVQSPSRVFAEIGSQVGAGLAQGITASVATVGEAAAALASGVTSSVEGSLAKTNTIRFNLPTRDAVAAGQRFGASVADGLATSVDDVARASDLIVGRASASFEALAFHPKITPTADLTDVEASLANARLASTVRPVLDDRRLLAALDAVTVTPVADLGPLTTALTGLRAAPSIAPHADLTGFARTLSASRFGTTVVPSAELAGLRAQIDGADLTPTVRPVGDLAPLRASVDALAFAPVVTPRADLAALSAAVNTSRFTPTVTPTLDVGPLVRAFGETPFTVSPRIDLDPLSAAVDRARLVPTVTPAVDLAPLSRAFTDTPFTITPLVDVATLSTSVNDLTLSPKVTPQADLAAMAHTIESTPLTLTPAVNLAPVTTRIAAFAPKITPDADLAPFARTLAETPFTVTPHADLTPVLEAVAGIVVTPKADLTPLNAALRGVSAAPTVAPRADLAAFASAISTTRFAATVTPSADLTGVAGQIDAATFTPLVRPLGDLAPLRTAIDGLAFAPTVTPEADLAPLVTTVNAARFAPAVVPTVDLGPLSETFTRAPFTVTPAVNLTPLTDKVDALTFAPLVTPSADLSNLVASVDTARLVPTVIPTADLAGLTASLRQLSFAPVVTPVLDPATFSTKGTEAGAALGAGVVTGVDAASPAVQDAFARVTTPAVSVDATALRPIGERLGRGVAEGLDQAGLQVDSAATKLSSRLTRTLGDVVDPSLTPGQGLVDGFHRAFGKITGEAADLRKFLLALGGTKFAPVQPPSAITIAEQGQSIQVARPQDRADAQTPRAAGLTVNQTFNEKIDPLHVAAELAWQLL